MPMMIQVTLCDEKVAPGVCAAHVKLSEYEGITEIETERFIPSKLFGNCTVLKIEKSLETNATSDFNHHPLILPFSYHARDDT